ncbi:DNA-binding protein [Paenimyroides tangerinum]|uniref:DNA-binding protein n=1 Tax=Paenimyroides tangerinum TaxID=2488728 RepID=A0A3P3W9X6_9FLAO|nr:HU family DNA-binding protein [Paenimyroides tangerinum]RRJ91941.1 DNA-binding protein [Paenimyroides tangerinum]
MAIKYKLIEKGQPGVVGGGIKKWYANVVNDGEMSIDDLVKSIEKFSALSEADIRGVIIALENVIQEALADSKIVRLDKLGTLYTGISSEGTATPEEFNAQTHIKNVRVNYRPGKRISDTLKTASLQRKK